MNTQKQTSNTPQPCQSCAEKQSAIDVWEGRYADLSAKCAELTSKYSNALSRIVNFEDMVREYKAKIKELEADRDLHKAKFEAINKDFDAMEADRDALAMIAQKCRDLLDKCMQLEADWPSALADEIMDPLDDSDPSDHASIIKRHDAAVLAEVVERIIDAASVGGETGVEVVRTMIKEREKS